MYNAQLTYDRIDEMSKLRGISIGKINEICSLSKNAISNAAKSEYGMKAKNIVLISEILDVSTDYLLGRTDNPTSSGNNIIQSSNVINGNNGNHSPLTVTETEKENNCKEIEVLLAPFQTASSNCRYYRFVGRKISGRIRKVCAIYEVSGMRIQSHD